MYSTQLVEQFSNDLERIQSVEPVLQEQFPDGLAKSRYAGITCPSVSKAVVTGSWFQLARLYVVQRRQLEGSLPGEFDQTALPFDPQLIPQELRERPQISFHSDPTAEEDIPPHLFEYELDGVDVPAFCLLALKAKTVLQGMEGNYPKRQLRYWYVGRKVLPKMVDHWSGVMDF